MRNRQKIAFGLLLAISCAMPVFAEETKSPVDAKGTTEAPKATAPATDAVKHDSAEATSETYAQHLASGKDAVSHKDSAKAISEFQAALAEAEKSKNDFGIAESCNELANIYIAKNDIIHASEYAKRAKDAAIKVLSDPKTQALASQLANNEENGSVWISHVMQAEFASQRKDYATAEKEYESAIDKAKEYAADGMPMATALVGLGKTYVVEGKYKEAEPVLRKAVDLCRKNWTPVTKSTADDGAEAMERLSVVLEKTGRQSEADKMLAESKHVRETKSFSQ